MFPHALTCTRRGALLRFQDTLRQAAKLDQEKVARQARHNQTQQNDSNNGAQLAREELERLNALSLKPAVAIALKFIAKQLKLNQGKKAAKRLAAITAAEEAVAVEDSAAAAAAAKEVAAAEAAAALAKEAAAAAAASLNAVIVAVDLAKFNWRKVRAQLRVMVSNAAKQKVASQVGAAKVERAEKNYVALFAVS